MSMKARTQISLKQRLQGPQQMISSRPSILNNTTNFEYLKKCIYRFFQHHLHHNGRLLSSLMLASSTLLSSSCPIVQLFPHKHWSNDYQKKTNSLLLDELSRLFFRNRSGDHLCTWELTRKWHLEIRRIYPLEYVPIFLSWDRLINYWVSISLICQNVSKFKRSIQILYLNDMK